MCMTVSGQFQNVMTVNMCAGSAQQITSSSTGGGQSHDHTLSANFSGSANSVLQPYLVLIYIIKT